MISSQPGYVLGEIGVLAARVDEQIAVPVHQPQFGEPELVGVETFFALEAGRIADPAVQPIGPRVVRAHDGAPLGGLIACEQFVPAVAAGVGECADLVLAADEKDRVRAGADGFLGADGGQVGGVADTRPAGEDVALLPLEDGGVDVGLSGQHPRLAERGHCRGDAVGRERSRGMLFEHTVSLVHQASPVKPPSPLSAVLSPRVIRRYTRKPMTTAASAATRRSVASALSAGVGAARAVL